jgi:carboxypeptidase C (cathepsin A)
VRVADSGHMVMFDQPERTAQVILELVGVTAGHPAP